jgi:Na+/H+ antiporter NhaD/arsenite permease-like protein
LGLGFLSPFPPSPPQKDRGALLISLCSNVHSDFELRTAYFLRRLRRLSSFQATFEPDFQPLAFRALRAQADIARYKRRRSIDVPDKNPSLDEAGGYFLDETNPEEDMSMVRFDTPTNKKWIMALSLGVVVSLLVMFLGVAPAVHDLKGEGPLYSVVAVSGSTPCTLDELTSGACNVDWSSDGSFCAVDGNYDAEYTFEQADLLSSVCRRRRLNMSPLKLVEVFVAAPEFQPSDQTSETPFLWVHLTQPEGRLDGGNSNSSRIIRSKGIQLRSDRATESFINFEPEKENNFGTISTSGNLFIELECRNCGAGSMLSVELTVRQLGDIGAAQAPLAAIIFISMLLVIAFDILPRALAGLLGVIFMLGLLVIADKTPDLLEVVLWLRHGVIVLLFGMMIVVGKLSTTGFFEYITFQVLRFSGGSRWKTLCLLCTLTAVASAFLDNVTTILLCAPLTFKLCSTTGMDVAPWLLVQTLSCNIGGLATKVGSLPNLIIGFELASDISFLDFMLALTPPTIIMFYPCLKLFGYLFPGEFDGTMNNYDKIIASESEFKIRNWTLLIQSLMVLGGIFAGFLLEGLHEIDNAWIALFGAVVLMLCSTRGSLHQDMEAVEWETLVFLCCLFIIVEGMSECGLIREIGSLFSTLIGFVNEDSQLYFAVTLLVWVNALGTSVVGNVAYPAAMIPVIRTLSDDLNLPISALAWALSLGACLGGNGTLLGAAVNVVAIGVAERQNIHLTFTDFVRCGMPTLLLTVAIGNMWLIIMVAIGEPFIKSSE